MNNRTSQQLAKPAAECRWSSCARVRKLVQGYCPTHYEYAANIGLIQVAKYVDAEAARARIEEHLTLGRNLATLSSVSGVPLTTLWYHVTEYPRRLHPTTHQRIMSAPLPTVTRIGIARRVEALRRIGWPVRVIADEAAMSTAALYSCMRGVPTEALANRLVSAYRRLCHKPGPSAQVRRKAEAAGFPSPFAWGEDIDDPDTQPDPTTGPDRRPTSSERRSELMFLLEQGTPLAVAAQQVGVKRETASGWLRSAS